MQTTKIYSLSIIRHLYFIQDLWILKSEFQGMYSKIGKIGRMKEE